MDARALVAVSLKSGLKVSTCVDLLNQGWTYVERLNEPAHWEAPIAQLLRRVRE